MLHLFSGLFGTGEVALRLPSALAAAATVPITYALGRELAGRRAGYYAAALVGVSLSLVYWGQMARGYTLGGALAAATALTFVRARSRGSRREVLWWVLAAVALCWTLFLGAFVLLAELLTLALPGAAPGARRRLAAGGAVVALCGVPLALIALDRGSAQLFWVLPPGANAARSALSFIASAHYEIHGSSSAALLIWLLLAFAAIDALLCVVALVRRQRSEAFALCLALAGVALMPIAVYLLSRLGHPLFVGRYFTPCLPFAALVLALPLARLRPRVLGLAALVALVALALGELVPTYGMNLDDWRSTTAAVLSLSAPGDCIGFDANDGFVDFSYYLAHDPAELARARGLVPILPADRLGSDPAIVERYASLSAAEVAALPARCGRLFLIESHDGSSRGSAEGRLIRADFLVMRERLGAAYAERIVRRFDGVSIYLFSAPRRQAVTP